MADYYQFLSIIFLKDFIELNVHSDMMIKKWETYAIEYKYCNCFLEYTNFKDDLISHKCLCCNKDCQHKFDEKLKEQFFNTYTFSTHGNNKFINCCEKVYILMNIWMIGKNLVKHNYLNKHTLTVS